MSPTRRTHRLNTAAYIDTDAIRRDHPIADCVTTYGIELRRSGSGLIGRCPFHDDGGRPNLYVYRSGRWICYRCGVSGDVIDFVQRIENVSFRDAVASLEGSRHPPRRAVTQIVNNTRSPRRIRKQRALSVDERLVLSAATELYANNMMTDTSALAYMAGRGFPPQVLERYHIGFARGGQLVAYLDWRRLPIPAAIRVGLLTRDRQEVMARRVTFPEFHGRDPVWLIGRLLEGRENAGEGSPKYLGLPGPKPLLGWSDVCHDARSVFVVEGPFDLLALRMWTVPGIALAGNYVSEQNLRLLERFERLYVALDQDDGGRKATTELVSRFGTRATPIALPTGVKDPAELAKRVDGERLLGLAIRAAVQGDDAGRLAA